MYKIAIIGTHGTGKSTLTYHLAGLYKAMGLNAKVVQEVARACPFPLNSKMDANGAMWIHVAHVKKELDAIAQGCEVLICDRSALDSFLYLKKQTKIWKKTWQEMCRSAISWMSTYDQLIYVSKGTVAVQGDAIRPADAAFQRDIEQEFEAFLTKHPELAAKVLHIRSDDIFKGYLTVNPGRRIVLSDKAHQDRALEIEAAIGRVQDKLQAQANV